MLSPHPSYPPLEMAASGGVAVTTVYANKDADALSKVSNQRAAPHSMKQSCWDCKR